METKVVGTNSIEDTSVIVPTFNEEKCIPLTLELLMKLAFREIIVADGGSLDGTPEIAERNGAHVVIEKGGGYGAAVLRGLHEAKGAFVVIFDVGFNYNPNDINKLVNILKENDDVGMVIGSRTVLKKSFFLKFLNITFRLLFGRSTTDVDSSFIAFRKNVMLDMRLSSSDFSHPVAIRMKLLRKGYKIVEVPVEYYKDRNMPRKYKVIQGFMVLRKIISSRFDDDSS